MARQIVGIESCLSAILACVIVCAPVMESRSLRRHHHSRLDRGDLEEMPVVPRGVPRLGDDLEHRDTYGYGRMDGRGYTANGLPARSTYRQLHHENAERERMEEEEAPSARRYGHENDEEGYATRKDSGDYEAHSQRRKETRKYDEGLVSNGLGARRRKRHNKHGSMVNYRRITEQDKKDMLLSRQHEQELELQSGENGGGPRESYELEVKEAQNSSICNYTVMSIPDIRGNRIPRDLEHVMCNHAGSSCSRSSGSYCCVQTYRNMEVSYGDGDKETMKLYVGCVCALQMFNDLQVVESPLRIHD